MYLDELSYEPKLEPLGPTPLPARPSHVFSAGELAMPTRCREDDSRLARFRVPGQLGWCRRVLRYSGVALLPITMASSEADETHFVQQP